MNRIILAILALCATAAHAQTRVTNCRTDTPNNAVCLEWSAVTTRVGGLPTVLPVTYRVEQQFNGGAWATLATSTNPWYYATNLAPGAYVFRAYAVEETRESGPSPTGSRTVPGVTTPPNPPNAPATFTIAVVIGADHAPIYSVVGKAPSFKVGTYFGAVPAGRECGDYVFSYRSKRFHRVDVKRTETWRYSGDLKNLAAPCASGA